MDDGPLATLAGVARDFVRDWRTLAGIAVFVVLISFVLITPMSEALLRMLVSRSGNAAVTDVDIALFFFTTKSGLTALLLLVAASIGITIFGQACLMTVGIARARGGRVRVRDAVAHGATRAIAILRLTLVLFARVLVLLFPSVASSLIVWSRHSPHKTILRTRSMISDNGIMVSKSGKIGSTRIIASRTTDLVLKKRHRISWHDH